MTSIETHRKKPVDVQMMLWDGDPFTARDIQDWVGEAPSDQWAFLTVEELAGVNEHAQLWVAHNGSWTSLPVGYRVAKEIDGSGFYPLSPEGFAAGYVQATG